MAISITGLDPLHYITAERVQSLRSLCVAAATVVALPDAYENPDAWADAMAVITSPAGLADLRVLLMALEQMTGSG